MEWSKIDAALATALSQAERPTDQFEVFVRLAGPIDALASESARVIASLIPHAATGRTSITAVLTLDKLEALASDPVVRSIRLCRRLRPLEA